MFTRFTFRKTNFAASRLGSWISKAFNRKTKVKNLIALPTALLTAALVITTFAFSARGWLAKPASTETTRGETQTQTQAESARIRIETELVTIRRHGFEPQEITRPADPFVLAVENRSGLEEVTLRLDRVAGNRLKEVNVPRRKLDWGGAFDLPPGRYVLTEANHSDWVCSITITAK
jgi:hypothetical protein